MNQAYEVNFDGLVGPTHNYSGLSYGNVASMQSQSSASNPREAAMQGLNKMKFLADFGILQGVFPPHERPYFPLLHSLGYQKNDLLTILKNFPELFYACFSAAPMWTANAATVSPSIDSADQKVHFTPANLSNKFHRSFEYETTQKILRTIFPNPHFFVHHDPLPSGSYFSDEGAANHSRFCSKYGNPGVQLFVYGRSGFRLLPLRSTTFPARQTYEASQALSRLHKLYPQHLIFAQQHPEAIDAGVFHNDVIAVGNQHVFLYHEQAFVDKDSVINQIKQKVSEYCQIEPFLIEIPKKRVSLDQTVKSYLFNSQIITLKDQTMILIAPEECHHIPEIAQLLTDITSDPLSPIASVRFLNLRQSMRNGGGPACLRLRVVLTEPELNAINPYVLLNDRLYEKLKEWIQKHYRDHLAPEDLADPKLIQEGQIALDELTKMLHLGSIYSFQK